MADMAMFLGALLIVYVVPGPDMILLLETGLLRGRGQALAVAAGLAIARAARALGSGDREASTNTQALCIGSTRWVCSPQSASI